MGSADGLDDASGGFVRRVSGVICSQAHVLGLAFVFAAVLLLLAVMSALFGDLNPATSTILLLDFVILGLVILLTGGLILHCRR